MFKFHCSTWPFHPKRLKPTALSEKRVLKQPCPTGGNGGIVSHQLPARRLPPANVSSAALQIALRISKVAGWVRLASVAGGQRTWTQPCFARLSRVPARTVSRDSWLEYIGAHYLPVEIFLIWTFAFRAIFIYVLYCYIVIYSLIISLMIDIEFNIAVENMVSA